MIFDFHFPYDNIEILRPESNILPDSYLLRSYTDSDTAANFVSTFEASRSELARSQ
jgi:hypothetical protein